MIFKTSIALALALACGSAAARAEQNELQDFMRVKLHHAQQSLEGLVLEDFEKVVKSSQEMSLLSLAVTWQVLETPEYVEYSRKFRRAADDLTRAAREKDLDRATTAYNQMTSRCVECHKYVRGVRMAAREPGLLPKRTQVASTRSDDR